jgi:hypothetical protein
VKKMIKEKREKSDWQFVFLSADLDAIGDALDSGVPAASTIVFDGDVQGVSAVWSSLSARVADYRAARSADVSFTDEDRAQQEGDKNRGIPRGFLTKTGHHCLLR